MTGGAAPATTVAPTATTVLATTAPENDHADQQVSNWIAQALRHLAATRRIGCFGRLMRLQGADKPL